MKKIAILISNAGTGTNLQSIIDGIESKKINAKVVIVVSDSDEAYGLIRAKAAKIPTKIYKQSFPLGNGKTGDNLEKTLKDLGVDLVCLAGWKRIIPDSMVANFKVLNIHPGLIPEKMNGLVKNPDGTDGLWNRGKFTTIAIQNFLDQKSTYAGSTVHFLSDEFDFGPVLERGFVKVKKGDTVETLYARLKKKENEIYVKALVELCR